MDERDLNPPNDSPEFQAGYNQAIRNMVVALRRNGSIREHIEQYVHPNASPTDTCTDLATAIEHMDLRQTALNTTMKSMREGADQQNLLAQKLVKQLADTLEMDRPWSELLWEVARLKRREQEKVQVENIISVLAGMDTLSSVMQHIKVQLGDEAIYEHLKTCADVVDEEETKQQLRDLAEIFAFEFCK